MVTDVKFIQQNEVNDVFSYIDEDGHKQYTSFPRSMYMTEGEVEDFLN